VPDPGLRAPWGLLVAGGRSRRFGRDKRAALLGGASLLQRAAAALRPLVGPRLLLAGGPSPPPVLPAGSRLVADAALGAGPAGALVAGLALSRGPVLVLACDVPFAGTDLLALLLRIARAGDRIAAARTRRGIEPLVACYPPSALRPLHAALREGRPSLRRILEREGVEGVAVDQGRVLNVNRPEDLERAAARFFADGR
jgi:molybdopterin-guanine dinucleotide biosynthesis protein A